MQTSSTEWAASLQQSSELQGWSAISTPLLAGWASRRTSGGGGISPSLGRGGRCAHVLLPSAAPLPGAA